MLLAAACMGLHYTHNSVNSYYAWLTQSSCRCRRRFAVSPTVARSPAAAGTFTNSTRAGRRSSEQPIRCPFSNSRFTVELSKVNHRRGRYCWTIIKETAGEAGNRCTPGRLARNKCCAETPEAFVLRNIGKGAAERHWVPRARLCAGEYCECACMYMVHGSTGNGKVDL